MCRLVCTKLERKSCDGAAGWGALPRDETGQRATREAHFKQIKIHVAFDDQLAIFLTLYRRYWPLQHVHLSIVQVQRSRGVLLTKVQRASLTRQWQSSNRHPR